MLFYGVAVVGFFLTGCDSRVDAGPADVTPPSRCFRHSECAVAGTPGICNLGWDFVQDPALKPNVCIPGQKLTYVDAGRCNTGRLDTSNAGTATDPFCQVSTAVDKKSTLVLVLHSATPYDKLQVSAGHKMVVVGAGREDSPASVIQGVVVENPNSFVYLSGLTLRGSLDAGLLCRDEASVVLEDSVVRDNNGSGVESAQDGTTFALCDQLSIHRSFIGHNKKHGLFVQSPRFFNDEKRTHVELYNSLIVRNRGVGILSGTTYFDNSFNTIAENGFSSVGGGTPSSGLKVEEGGGVLFLSDAGTSDVKTAVLRNTIIVGNYMPVNDAKKPSTQIVTGSPPNIELSNVVVSETDTLAFVTRKQGVKNLKIVFRDTDTIRWCIDSQNYIDLRDQAVYGAPTKDYFGNPRPRYPAQRKADGTGFDIGHQQLP